MAHCKYKTAEILPSDDDEGSQAGNYFCEHHRDYIPGDDIDSGDWDRWVVHASHDASEDGGGMALDDATEYCPSVAPCNRVVLQDHIGGKRTLPYGVYFLPNGVDVVGLFAQEEPHNMI